jgi:hypothetical protein
MKFRKRKEHVQMPKSRPDLYYAHIWVSKTHYDVIKGISDMENMSLKETLGTLVEAGAQLYAETQVTMKKLQRAVDAKEARDKQEENAQFVAFLQRMQRKVFGKNKTDNNIRE